MVYQAISPEAIKWVETELDPFVKDTILPLAPPHALLHYCAGSFPLDTVNRRLYVATLDHDGRRTRRPLSFPDQQPQVVHPLSDAELTAFTDLYMHIQSQFASFPSPLFMARRLTREDTLPEDRSQILLASLLFGANLKYPWA
ncbi:MAG: hypothetical protein V1487_02225 [bacterium]